jgi:peptidyl-prolyl cis-trans isomerase B (cyclophilin B)
VEEFKMVRMTVLCLSMAVLAQLMPQGCPLTPADKPPDAERRSILTAASAPTTAAVGETITLTATAASDVEGGALAYSWIQTAGPGVQILNANQPTASFVAPSLASDATLTFAVMTANERGDAGRANISVLVQADPDYGQDQSGTTASGAPIARAGPDRDVTEAVLVTLDASNSRGDSLTYEWEQTSGTNVELTDADQVKATFTAPAFEIGETNELEFTLTVRDRRGRSSQDTLVLTVIEGTGAEPTPHVLLHTSMGDIRLELDRTKAPTTVNNFLQYVEDGFYDGTIFHRVIPDFVVQGGGFEPGLVEKETRDPITNESNNGLSNTRGTVAMARTSDPNSATSQFYINLKDNSGTLDYQSPSSPGYAVFGTVTAGMDVVDAIAAVETGSQGGMQDVPVEDVILIEARRVAKSASSD